VSIGGRIFRIRRGFLDDLRDSSAEATIVGLQRALMIFHSRVDATVVDNARWIFEVARHPKSVPRAFVGLDDADHLLSRQADAAYVARSWPRRRRAIWRPTPVGCGPTPVGCAAA